MARLPLKRKLQAVTIATVLAALLPAFGVLLAYDIASARQWARAGMQVLGSMVAEHEAAALRAGRPADAAQILNSLEHRPAVRVAYIYDGAGGILARYIAAGEPENPPPLVAREGDGIGNGRAWAWRKIVLDGQPIGWVYIEADQQAMYRRVSLMIWCWLLAMGGCSLAAFLVASRFQRLLCSPLLHLADTAKAVTHSRNYSIRASKAADDEIGMLTDCFNEMLSEIQRRDGQLQTHSESLEAAVLDRTSELRSLNGMLLEARDRAVEGNRCKSQFLANVSHELRTPMNGILGLTELALETTLDPQQRGFLSLVQSSAESLLGIVNDILDFSKIEAGKLALEPVPFRLHETVGETVKLLEIQARRKGLDLSCKIEPQVPRTFLGDPLRLRQVLLNLVGNAVKFTDQGRVAVEVSVEHATQGLPRLRFRVRDTGIGIPQEKRECIFEAFAQADGSHTRRFGGTGLGLTISARLVELMGGSIEVESRPGQGSCFHFAVPFEAIKEPEAPARSAPRPLASEIQAESARRLHILLAEDNPVNQQITQKALERRGYLVTATENGRKAVEAFGLSYFDLVLMDVQMPEMDGFEATAIIRERERERGEHVPIVALTAHALTDDRERCLACGMDDYLSKPVHTKDLLETVARLADARHEDANRVGPHGILRGA